MLQFIHMKMRAGLVFLNMGHVMDEGLLSEILTVEQDIHRHLNRLKEELATSQVQLRKEFDEHEHRENARWEAACADRVAEVTAKARCEADAFVAESAAYAAWLDALDDAQLEAMVSRHLHKLGPECGYDRPDE